MTNIEGPGGEGLFGEGFGSWEDWAPGIDATTLEGPLAQGVRRVSTSPSLGTVTHELVRFEPGARALSYVVVDGLPPILEKLRVDWTVLAIEGDRARLVGVSAFGLRDQAAPKRGPIEAKMTQTLQGFAEALRAAVEES